MSGRRNCVSVERNCVFVKRNCVSGSVSEGRESVSESGRIIGVRLSGTGYGCADFGSSGVADIGGWGTNVKPRGLNLGARGREAITVNVRLPRGIPLIKKAQPLNSTSRSSYLYWIGADKAGETIDAARARTAARFM